jgi:protein phosphatase
VIERVQPSSVVADVRIAVGAATAAGGRPANEDRVHVGELAPTAGPSGHGSGEAAFLLAVADGMGGHQQGEVASRLAIEAVVTAVGSDPGPDPALLLKQAFRQANEAIYTGGQAAAQDDPMGTTLVAAVLRGKYATIASIGDSRAYLVRANALTQITTDHSLVEEQVAQGTITADQAKRSPSRNILTHALGQRPKLDPRLPEIFELTLLPRDRLLLCTDGFYDVIDDREYVQTLLELEPAAAANRLIGLAVERGTSDNVSAVIAEALPTRVQAPILQQVPPAGRGRLSGQLVAMVALVVIIAVAVLLVFLGVFP